MNHILLTVDPIATITPCYEDVYYSAYILDEVVELEEEIAEA